MDEKEPRRRAPVSAWQSANSGIDTDPYLRSYRRSSRPHESAGEALEFYTRLFLEAPLAIVITTPQLHIADANNAAQKLLQRSLNVMRDKPFQRFIAKDERQAFRQISTEISESRFRVTRPVRFIAADETESEVSLTACALRDENGTPELIMMIIVERGDDVSEDLL